MKQYLLLGVIALAMVLAVPVMATDATTPLVASGNIVSSLSITNNQPALTFNTFAEGVNEKDSVGTITVDALWTAWTVTTSTAPVNDGYMYNGAIYLNNPLEEYNYNSATWSNVKAFTFSGPKTTTPSSTSMLESFRQTIVAADAPGTYTTTIVYTVTAV
jgi:hypothetical protein